MNDNWSISQSHPQITFYGGQIYKLLLDNWAFLYHSKWSTIIILYFVFHDKLLLKIV